MSRLDDLGHARMHLAQAVTRSKAGHTFSTEEHATAAAQTLRYAGREDLAERVTDATASGATRTAARTELRSVMQHIDAAIVDVVGAEPVEETFATQEVRS